MFRLCQITFLRNSSNFIKWFSTFVSSFNNLLCYSRRFLGYWRHIFLNVKIYDQF